MIGLSYDDRGICELPRLGASGRAGSWRWNVRAERAEIAEEAGLVLAEARRRRDACRPRGGPSYFDGEAWRADEVGKGPVGPNLLSASPREPQPPRALRSLRESPKRRRRTRDTGLPPGVFANDAPAFHKAAFMRLFPEERRARAGPAPGAVRNPQSPRRGSA